MKKEYKTYDDVIDDIKKILLENDSIEWIQFKTLYKGSKEVQPYTVVSAYKTKKFFSTPKSPTEALTTHLGNNKNVISIEIINNTNGTPLILIYCLAKNTKD